MGKHRPNNRNDHYIGQIFHKWEVLAFLGHIITAKSSKRNFLLKCLGCNNQFERRIEDVIHGKSKACKSCSVKLRYTIRKNRITGSASKCWKGTKDIPLSAYTKAKYGAKSRKLPFHVSIEDLQLLWDLQNGRCALTKRPLKFNNKSTRVLKEKAYNYASLDRIDSTAGYYLSNIQWVSVEANIAKNSLSIKEFKALITDLYVTLIKEESVS